MSIFLPEIIGATGISGDFTSILITFPFLHSKLTLLKFSSESLILQD